MVKRKLENLLSDKSETIFSSENINGKRPNDSNNQDTEKRIKTKSLYRQPTANELNRLQETENLFNSNLFRLQIEEILKEVKVKDKTAKKFQEWFSELKTYLLSIPQDDAEYDLSEKSFSKKLNVKLPLGKEHDQTKIIFKFHKFGDVEIVGSYLLGCSINTKLIIDIQITVPAETYTKNDSINYKYHKKRAAYLALIASYLNKLEIISEVKYTFLNGCETRPILHIKPNEKLAHHLSVHLHLACEAEAYKLHRFSPSRSNLRDSWLFSLEKVEDVMENSIPTPYYNNSVLCDVTASVNQDLLKDTLINSENLKQAIVLLKIWIKQRNLNISGYIVSMLIVFFVQTKRINNIMSSYQIIRNVWIALKSSEWDVKGITLCKDKNTASIEEFNEHFPVVFIDRTGYYNIFWQMCRGTYYALRRESELALEMLDNGKINGFIPLFMTPVMPLLQFDHLLRFHDFCSLKESVVERATKSTRFNYGLDHLTLATNDLYNLMLKGLNNRVHLILQVVEADFTWSIKKKLDKAKKEGYKENVMFGIIMNPENAMNIVDKGPPANMPEAEEFRAFWGEKSELRRFQDGSITEACVWNADCIADRRDICRQILDYLLPFKYGPAGRTAPSSPQPALAARRLEEASAAVHDAFDALRHDLRALRHLPLEISSVLGTSAVFSCSSASPPQPAPGPGPGPGPGPVPALRASRVVIELAHSGKWPGDLEAFRCVKAAFHLQLAEQLKKQFHLPTQASDSHVDVLKNGYVFRLQVAHPKEITLIKRELEGGVVKYRESEEADELYRETVLLPQLRGVLHGLHRRHPAFGPAACLLRRWLSGQLLAPHFPGVLADLLVAVAFLRPAPLSPPAAPLTALLRALHLLAHTDWAAGAVLLDLDDEPAEESAEETRRLHELGAGGVQLLTAQGGRLARWAARGGAGAARRARGLARAALQHAHRTLLDAASVNLLEMFVPSLRGYDVLIRLAPGEGSGEALCRGPQGLAVVDFDPAQKYLDELNAAYGEFAVFFHDALGGRVVGVLWKPDVHEPRDFQVLNANALKPVHVDGKVRYKVNIEAIVEDFKILGQGLVTEVSLNND